MDCLVSQASETERERFKGTIYNKYLLALSKNITGRFPDIELINEFRIFDPSRMPTEIQSMYDRERLACLANHYATHHIIDSEATGEEICLCGLYKC